MHLRRPPRSARISWEKPLRSHLVPALILLLTGGTAAQAGGSIRIHEFDSPAGAGSGEPNLAVSDGAAWLTWFEKREEGHALLLARLEDGVWSEPRTIAAGRPFFVNWADFPSLLPLGDGTLAVHWPEKSADDTYAYDVMISRSTDGGHSWSEPFRPHSDGTPTEHGFVSLLDAGGGAFSAVWLDGRAFAGENPTREMKVRFATWTPEGFREEAVLDELVCDCCQTAAVSTGGGPFVVYRDRSDDEVRDISYVRRSDGRWSSPRSVHDDGWEIPACPVNGPAIVAGEKDLAVAWFTGTGDAGGHGRRHGRVLLAFASEPDGGFDAPVRIDGGNPVGRVHLMRLPDERVLVSWIERAGGKNAEIRVRVVARNGKTEKPVVVATVAGSRASGFPRLIRTGEGGLLAWTEPGESPRVRVARIEVKSRSRKR